MGEENQQHEATPGTGQEVKPLKVAVNERGNRIGATHHNATIPEHIIQRLRYLHEEEGIGYRRLGKMFNLTRNTVVKVCRYQRRGQVPHAWKRVKATRKAT